MVGLAFALTVFFHPANAPDVNLEVTVPVAACPATDSDFEVLGILEEQAHIVIDDITCEVLWQRTA